MPLSSQGLWGGGDDNAGGEPVGGGEVGDAWGGDDAGRFYRCAADGEAGGESGSDPGGGFAGVHADEDLGVIAKVVSESKAYCVDGGPVERGLAGDGADAVGAEELLHSWVSKTDAVEGAGGEAGADLLAGTDV